MTEFPWVHFTCHYSDVVNQLEKMLIIYRIWDVHFGCNVNLTVEIKKPIYVSRCFACTHLCFLCSCLALCGQKGHQVLLNWTHRCNGPLWALAAEPDFSGNSGLNCWTVSPAPIGRILHIVLVYCVKDHVFILTLKYFLLIKNSICYVNI